MGTCIPILAFGGTFFRTFGTIGAMVTIDSNSRRTLSDEESAKMTSSRIGFLFMESIGNACIYMSTFGKSDAFLYITFIPSIIESIPTSFNNSTPSFLNLMRAIRITQMIVGSIFSFISVSRTQDPNCNYSNVFGGVLNLICIIGFIRYSFLEHRRAQYEQLEPTL